MFHHIEFERLDQSGSLPVLNLIAIELALVFQHRASDAKQPINATDSIPETRHMHPRKFGLSQLVGAQRQQLKQPGRA